MDSNQIIFPDLGQGNISDDNLCADTKFIVPNPRQLHTRDSIADKNGFWLQVGVVRHGVIFPLRQEERGIIYIQGPALGN